MYTFSSVADPIVNLYKFSWPYFISVFFTFNLSHRSYEANCYGLRLLLQLFLCGSGAILVQ